MAPRNPPHTMPSDRAPDRAPVKRRPDDRGINSEQLASIPKPTPAARAKAQANLAVMSLDQADPQEWLTELLDALDLREHDWRALLNPRGQP